VPSAGYHEPDQQKRTKGGDRNTPQVFLKPPPWLGPDQRVQFLDITAEFLALEANVFRYRV
jgi:hypothetical protein